MANELGNFVEKSAHKKVVVRSIIISSAISLLVGGAVSGIVVYQQYKKYDDPNIAKLLEVYDIMIDEYFFGEEDIDKSVVDAAINGMTSCGDNYTFYTTNKEDQHLSTTQQGLGFKFIYYGGNAFVQWTYGNAPCNEVGLSEGDVILSSWVNDEEKVFADLSYSEFIDAIYNDESNTLKYRILDKETNSEKIIQFDRGDYYYYGAKKIDSRIVGGKLIATIKVDTFLDQHLEVTVRNVLKLIEDEHGQQIDQLTIDLRSNGGGYVQSAVNLCGLFLPKGSTVLQYVYKDGTVESYKTSTNPTYSHIKKFNIIQDRNSASASETFALAMKYAKDATIFGTTSYGKGIVQSLKYFSDGSVLRYTSAKSQYPISQNEAVCIHGIGIAPSDGYDLNDCFYFYGELNLEAYTQEEQKEIKDRIIRSVNLLLGTSYASYNEALEKYQEARSLSITSSMNLETGRLLQKELYDYYLVRMESFKTTYIGE
ncbi:MAG: S41 family peptidase [Bacilli bacterium]